MKQMSRVQWLTLGDVNTGDLFGHMKSTLSHNTITSLTKVTGLAMHSQEAIEKKVVIFYQGLFGKATTCLPSLDTNIIRRGGMLNRDQQLQLAAPVTKRGVELAL